VIPRTLAQNCGANVIRTLTKLRAKHAEATTESTGGKACTFGIDGNKVGTHQTCTHKGLHTRDYTQTRKGLHTQGYTHKGMKGLEVYLHINRARRVIRPTPLCIPYHTGTIVDMKELGVWEAYAVKVQSIKTAVESAAMLLRIDDIVSGLSQKGKGPSGGNSGNTGVQTMPDEDAEEPPGQQQE
jgi:hypothetical protein